MVLSGKNGTLEVDSCMLLDFTNGNLEYGSNIETFAARSGGGAEETAAGLDGGSGSFELVYNDANLFDTLVSSGDLVTIDFRHSELIGLATGQGRIGRISREVNRDGTIQKLTVPFTCHKAWTIT